MLLLSCLLLRSGINKVLFALSELRCRADDGSGAPSFLIHFADSIFPFFLYPRDANDKEVKKKGEEKERRIYIYGGHKEDME